MVAPPTAWAAAILLAAAIVCRQLMSAGKLAAVIALMRVRTPAGQRMARNSAISARSSLAYARASVRNSLKGGEPVGGASELVGQRVPPAHDSHVGQLRLLHRQLPSRHGTARGCCCLESRRPGPPGNSPPPMPRTPWTPPVNFAVRRCMRRRALPLLPPRQRRRCSCCCSCCPALQPKEIDTSSSLPWYQSKPAEVPGLS